MQVQLKTKTAETETAFDTLYDTTSKKLDMIIGVLGKTSNPVKLAAKLLSFIRRGSVPASNPAPTS